MSRPSEKVLVVEDEALILFTIAQELRDEGFEVFEASSADEAIRLLSAHEDIRLLFTDIDMPGSMDGLKLSAYVRDRWPPVRIIVTSGKQVPEATTLPLGSQFVSKPYTTKGILEAVRAILA